VQNKLILWDFESYRCGRKVGSKQGCTLFPTPFSVFMNDFVHISNDTNIGVIIWSTLINLFCSLTMSCCLRTLLMNVKDYWSLSSKQMERTTLRSSLLPILTICIYACALLYYGKTLKTVMTTIR